MKDLLNHCLIWSLVGQKNHTNVWDELQHIETQCEGIQDSMNDLMKPQLLGAPGILGVSDPNNCKSIQEYISAKIDTVESKVNATESKVDATGRNADALAAKIKGNMKAAESKVDAIEGKLLDALAANTKEDESKVDTIKGKLDALAAGMKQMKDMMVKLMEMA